MTDVRKPLLAVRRLVEKGNAVQFGPEPEQNCITNARTGKGVGMECKGGPFVIAASFVKKLEAPGVLPRRPGERS